MSLVWLFFFFTVVLGQCLLSWCAWPLCVLITAPFLVQVQVWLVECEAIPDLKGWRGGVASPS